MIIDGQEYTFKEYAHPRPGDIYLDSYGGVVFSIHHLPELRAILEPVRKKHELGGVHFEETGEKRTAQREWFLFGGIPTYSHLQTVRSFLILRLCQ